MKLVVALAAAGLLLLPAGVTTAAPGPGGPGRDFALGGGKTETDIFNIAVHAGPNGEDARGHMKARHNPAFEDFTFDIEGEVTCLRVVGNRAAIGGRLTKSIVNGEPFFPNLEGFLFYVEDNGNKKANPDRISFQFLIAAPPVTCPNPGTTQFPMTQGNIIVHDS
jgi:hypothetical protein